MDQGTKRTDVDALLANPFDRFELGPGLIGWVYRFTNPRPLPIPKLTTAGHEIAIELAGEWTVEVWGAGATHVPTGGVFAVPAGLLHQYRFRALPGDPEGVGARRSTGLQVGFSLLPTELDDRWQGLTVPRTLLDGPVAAGLRALAHLTLAWRRGPRAGAPGALRGPLLELLARALAPLPRSAALQARREIEATPDRPLYLHHFAESVGLGAKTLSRRFVEATGVPPIRFRTELRLHHAVRLLWSRPDLSIPAIARTVGIDDPRFFHRLVRKTFGLTPAQLGRRS